MTAIVANRRRAGRLGDVWYPIGNNPRFPVATPSDYLESVTRLRRSAEAASRDPSTIGLAYSASWLNDREAERLPNGERRFLTGAPDQVADDIKAFADIGVRHLMCNFNVTRLRRRWPGWSALRPPSDLGLKMATRVPGHVLGAP